MVAHDLAGTGDVAGFVGELQQGKPAFDTLGQSGHGDPLRQIDVWYLQSARRPGDRSPLRMRQGEQTSLNSECRKITKPLQSVMIIDPRGIYQEPAPDVVKA